MMSTRDEFSPKTKRYLAARASWLCSFRGCRKPTIGPSEESSHAVSSIGKAAHVSGAVPGPGSRRYDALMSSADRSHIDNAIWLCSDHADLIDRDEVTYTVSLLRTMKREHETACAKALAAGRSVELNRGLLAIGPDIVLMGEIRGISAEYWNLHLEHFFLGDVHTLISYIDKFSESPIESRYVLSSEVGDGRVLAGAPILSKTFGELSLVCPVASSAPCIDAESLPTELALRSDDLYANSTGDIATVSGLESLPQKIQSILSMQLGESPFHATFGVRFFEYFEPFRESPWLNDLLKLEVVRQLAIPYVDAQTGKQYTPLQCVTSIVAFELLSLVPTNNRLPVRLRLQVQGVGAWEVEIAVYLPTAEQMAMSAMRAAEWKALIAGTNPR